jgi:hypothetical protein
VLNNFAQKTTNRFWLLKPNLKADTVALMKNHVKKINFFIIEDYIGGVQIDSISKRCFYGSWTINSDANKIVESIWNGSEKTNFWNFDIKFTCTKSDKNKIVEINEKNEIEKRKLKMIHHLNRNFNIENSLFYYLSNKYEGCEDVLSMITNIIYKYDNGLLVEIEFINDGMFSDRNFCFLKFIVTYEYF